MDRARLTLALVRFRQLGPFSDSCWPEVSTRFKGTNGTWIGSRSLTVLQELSISYLSWHRWNFTGRHRLQRFVAFGSFNVRRSFITGFADFRDTGQKLISAWQSGTRIGHVIHYLPRIAIG